MDKLSGSLKVLSFVNWTAIGEDRVAKRFFTQWKGSVISGTSSSSSILLKVSSICTVIPTSPVVVCISPKFDLMITGVDA